MREEALKDFDIPWCQALFSDPAYFRQSHPERVPEKADEKVPRVINGPLWSDKTIRACACFYKRPPRENRKRNEKSYGQGAELAMLYSLGSDVGGHPGLCHGGIIAIMLDELTAGMAWNLFQAEFGFTASLKTTFVKEIKIPGVVRARAWVDPDRPIQGKKTWVMSVVEDGDGTVYARGEALWIRWARSTRAKFPDRVIS